MGVYAPSPSLPKGGLVKFPISRQFSALIIALGLQATADRALACLRADVSYFLNKGNRRRLHAGKALAYGKLIGKHCRLI